MVGLGARPWPVWDQPALQPDGATGREADGGGIRADTAGIPGADDAGCAEGLMCALSVPFVCLRAGRKSAFQAHWCGHEWSSDGSRFD
jgi:hypothetical protein